MSRKKKKKSLADSIKDFMKRKKVKLYFVVVVNEYDNQIEVIVPSAGIIEKYKSEAIKFLSVCLGEATFVFNRARMYFQMISEGDSEK